MRRLLMFGLLGPYVASVAFSVLVLVLTIASNPADAPHAQRQWVDVIAGSFSPGRILFYVPAALLGWFAMPFQARAQATDGVAAWIWWAAAWALFGLPAAALGFIVMPNPVATVLGAAISGAAGLGLASLLAPVAPASVSRVEQPAFSPRAPRTEFGQRRR